MPPAVARLLVRQNAAAATLRAGTDGGASASRSGSISADDRDPGSCCGRAGALRRGLGGLPLVAFAEVRFDRAALAGIALADVCDLYIPMDPDGTSRVLPHRTKPESRVRDSRNPRRQQR